MEIRPKISRSFAVKAGLALLLLLVPLVLIERYTQPLLMDDPALLYLAPDESGLEQLHVITIARQRAQPLTHNPHGVVTYAYHAPSQMVAYLTNNQTVWLFDLRRRHAIPAFTCPARSVCANPGWSPDGQTLVYEQAERLAEGEIATPHLWAFDVERGTSSPLNLTNEPLSGYDGRWSADGNWFAYSVPDLYGVKFISPADGRTYVHANGLAGPTVWHSTENIAVFPALLPAGEGFMVHLMRADLETGGLTDITGAGEPVEAGSPQWSPDGMWLALTRKPVRASMGRQIWLQPADPDQAAAYAVTNDPQQHHARPVWSPDGRTLAFQRSPVFDASTWPEVVLLTVSDGKIIELVQPARHPTWLVN